MTSVNVSIILVNYNTVDLTAACIDSIFSYTQNIQFEVIVVDNASSDGSKKFFEKDERIQYIYEDKNHGFGKANNIGASRAKGKYLLFLNSDTLLYENAIFDLFRFLENNRGTVICGGNLVSKDKLPTSSFERIYPSISYVLNELFLKIPGKIIFGKNTSYNYTRKPIEVAYVSGADLMILTETFIAIHGFDERFFMYYEETDLCKRASKLGKIYSIPSAHIIHFGGQSSKDSPKLPSNKKLSIQHDSACLYFSKHYSTFYIWIYRLLRTITNYSRYFQFIIVGNKDKADLWKRVIDINHKKNKEEL